MERQGVEGRARLSVSRGLLLPRAPVTDSGLRRLPCPVFSTGIQTVLLNFPVITSGNPPGAPLSWPHVSVATLQKTFGGQ
jgi:hypothetical protein